MADEILVQAPVQCAYDILMRFARAGRHEQLPVDDLVALSVIGQGVEHGNGPVTDGRGHTHTLDPSAQRRQVFIAQHVHARLNAHHLFHSARKEITVRSRDVLDWRRRNRDHHIRTPSRW